VSGVDFDLDKLHDIPDPYAASAPAPSAPVPQGPSPTRSSVSRRRAVLVGVSLCFATLAALRMGVAPRQAPGAAFFVVALGLPAIGGLAALAAGWAAGAKGLGLRTAQLASALGVAVALFALSTLAEHLGAVHEGGMKGTGACAAISALLAAVPLAAGFVAFRRSLAGNVALRMACFGVGSGVLGAVLLRVHCPNDAAAHVALGHGAAVLLGALAGAIAGRATARL
jgi:hypothetical protein